MRLFGRQPCRTIASREVEKTLLPLKHMKTENILIAVAVVCIGTVALRLVTHKAPAKNTRTVAAINMKAHQPQIEEHVSSSDSAPVKQRRYTNNTARYAAIQRQAKRSARQLDNKIQNKHDVMLAYYQKLQGLPGMELHRMEWLEKMAHGPFTQDEISKFAYSEMLSSTPLKDLPERDNDRRRIAVNLAFNMYLEQCDRFESCHEQAVAALVQTPDPALRKLMFREITDRYSEPEQQDQLYVQMQRYGLTGNLTATASN